jgi:glycosylphosphatidylinositol deacylase
MRRHSSGSSEDDDASPVEAPHVNSSRFSAKDSRSSAHPTNKLDHHRGADRPPSFSISRRSSSINWRLPESRNGNGTVEKRSSPERTSPSSPLGLIMTANGELRTKEVEKAPETVIPARRPPWRSPWAITFSALVAAIVGIGFLVAVLHSSVTRQLDPKGCRMSYMRPSYAKLNEFDTEHTRLASKYSLYLYREQGIDHDTKV